MQLGKDNPVSDYTVILQRIALEKFPHEVY